MACSSAAARQPDHLRPDRDPALVQRLDRDLVALARPRPARWPCGTRQLSRISSQVDEARMPELVLLLAHLKAREVRAPPGKP